jgi:hypothetical protein
VFCSSHWFQTDALLVACIPLCISVELCPENPPVPRLPNFSSPTPQIRGNSNLLYGMFSDVYTATELRQNIVSDPFDRSESPRQLKLVELTD